MVRQRQRVIGQHLDAVRAGGVLAQAVAALVKQHHPVIGGERRRDLVP